MPFSNLDREEALNAASHGLGLLVALAALPVLIWHAVLRGDAWHVVGCSVFGLCMVFTMTASMLYHSASRPERKRALRILDHVSIFLLIAGGYTPFCLTTLRELGGTTLLIALWTLAAGGVFFKLRYTGRFDLVSTLIYLGMGWMGILTLEPMLFHMRTETMTLIGMAAFAFTFGVLFYVMDDRRGFHFAWHLFVIAGCSCLYGAVFQELPPFP